MNYYQLIQKTLIVIFLTVFSVTAPFYIGISAVFFYIITRKEEWIYIFFISFIFLFCNMNLHKEAWAFGDFLGVGNDLGWYSTQWYAFNNYEYGFLSIFDDDYAIFINDGFLVQPKISEPIYHGFSYFFSKITDANFIFYTYTLTFFIYIPACIVLFKMLKSSKKNEILIALVLVFFIFYSMTFTNMFNMIRHYCSGSFLIITLYFIYSKRIRWAFLFGILAVLTHNAAIVVCAIYILVFYIEKLPYKKDWIKVLYVVIGSSTISLLYLSVYFATFTNYEKLDDKGAGLLLKSLDIILIAISFFCYKYRVKSYFDKLWFYYVGIIILIFFMHFTSFLQLRYYAYFDYFRWIGLVYIFSFIIRIVKFKLLFFFIVLFILIVFLWLRIYISDFDFNGLLHSYFIVKF